jgi:TonB family protein
MNRLQKKCVIGTAGIHLLLLTILLVGPAFFNPKPKPDDTQVLDVIPANLIDAALNSGVSHAQPPPPVPTVVPQPQFTPPVQPPLPEKIERTRPQEILPKPDLARVEKPEKRPTHKIEVNTHLVDRTAARNSTTTDNSRQNARAIQNAIRNLKRDFSPSTTVDMPGTSDASYASYKDALASIYYNAWTTPNDTANDEANTKVKITVAADGTVINAQIIAPSGDAKADESVRRALERVISVPPLPDQSKKERDFTISFNLKTKRMLE